MNRGDSVVSRSDGALSSSDGALIWSDTASSLQLTVACEGGTHHIGWEAGRLRLADHPDLDAELAMVGLGGAEPACLSRYHLWNDATADGGFLGEWVDDTRLSPSWFSWLAMALERMRAEGFHEFLRALPPARAQRMGEFLHQFPPSWLDRAAAAVSESVAEGQGVGCVLAPQLLPTAVGNRLRRAFVDAVGGRQLAVGSAALVPLRISVLAADDATETSCMAAGVLIGPDRGISLTVDRSWLHRVWGAEASLIDGRLVLALDEDSAPDTRSRIGTGNKPDTAVARLVSWQTTVPGGHRPTIERHRVRFTDGSWSIAD